MGRMDGWVDAAWAAADPSINNGPDGDSLSHESQSAFWINFREVVCLSASEDAS